MFWAKRKVILNKKALTAKPEVLWGFYFPFPSICSPDLFPLSQLSQRQFKLTALDCNQRSKLKKHTWASYSCSPTEKSCQWNCSFSEWKINKDCFLEQYIWKEKRKVGFVLLTRKLNHANMHRKATKLNKSYSNGDFPFFLFWRNAITWHSFQYCFFVRSIWMRELGEGLILLLF